MCGWVWHAWHGVLVWPGILGMGDLCLVPLRRWARNAVSGSQGGAMRVWQLSTQLSLGPSRDLTRFLFHDRKSSPGNLRPRSCSLEVSHEALHPLCGRPGPVLGHRVALRPALRQAGTGLLL